MSRKEQAYARNADRNNANSDAPKRTTIPFPVAELHAHPLQAKYFNDLPDAEFQELKAGIAQNGIRHPPEILPNGTILRGHQRVRAARELGWTMIDIIIRDDLVDADEATVAEALIDDNLHRRQLSPIEQGACAVRLAEIEADRRGYTDFWQRGPFIKKAVQARLQCSSRNATRHIALAKAGRPLREAVDRGLLPLAWAERLAALPEEESDWLTLGMQKLMNQPDKDGRSLKAEARKLANAAFEAAARERPDRRRSAQARNALKAVLLALQRLAQRCDTLVYGVQQVLVEWKQPPNWIVAKDPAKHRRRVEAEQQILTLQLNAAREKLDDLVQQIERAAGE